LREQGFFAVYLLRFLEFPDDAKPENTYSLEGF
jgi:hypothetical protein